MGKSKSQHEWDLDVYITREQEAKARLDEISQALTNAKKRFDLKNSISEMRLSLGLAVYTR